MRVLLTVIGLIALVVLVSNASSDEPGVLDVGHAAVSEFEQLEAKLARQLPARGVNDAAGPTVRVVVRPGPVVEPEGGEAMDLGAFRDFLREDGWDDERRVVLAPAAGVTYEETVSVVDALLMVDVTDIRFAGETTDDDG